MVKHTWYNIAPQNGPVAMAMLRLLSTIAAVRALLLGYMVPVTANATTSTIPPPKP